MAASRHGLNAPAEWGVKEGGLPNLLFLRANRYCSFIKIIMAWKIYDVKGEPLGTYKHGSA
ncbi:hypothetical protein HK26_02590 [Acetobacter okinawensis]|uniref:Uncharacterized protein n=1 Tax=Acetobacter okinawensis TaxID=1076594 RepID=A0A252BU86_9PROT|nr:hypothetical protein HK26_02590 [Acetobacter okinawensis]